MHVPKFSVEFVSLDIPLLGIASQIHLNSVLTGSTSLGAIIFAIGLLGAACVYLTLFPLRFVNDSALRKEKSAGRCSDTWNDASTAMAIISRDGRIIALNASAKALFSQRSDSYIGQTLQGLASGKESFDPAEHPLVEDQLSAASTIAIQMRDGARNARELRGLVFPSANTHNNETTYSVVFSPFEGSPIAPEKSSNRQLSEYQTVLSEALPGALQAEVDLIETRQLHLTTVSTLREGIMVFSKEGRVLSCNPSAERILGLPLEKMFEERSSFSTWPCIREDGSVFPPEDFPVVRALTTGQPCEGVVMGVARPNSNGDMSDDKNIVWLLVNAAPVIELENAYCGTAVVSMIDISSLKASEKMQVELLKTVETARREIQHQRNLFKGIYDGAPDGMIETGMDRTIRSVNPGVQRIFGYEPGELIGKSTQLLYASDDDWSKIGRRIDDSGQPDIMNAEAVDFARKDGQIFPGVINGAILRDDDNKAIGYIAVMRDITHERQRDKALEDSKRLESLGRLTAGIAHDFNNLLTVISVNLQLIDMSVHTAEMKRKVQAALLATNMGAKLNQRLTGMARKRRLNAEPISLNATIRGLYDILRVGLGERSEIKLALASDLHLTNVDPNEVENVLINLIINSRDAMPEGGRLSIETNNVDTRNSDRENNAQRPPGLYVRLAVTDTGSGMTADVLQHAIEPFYTTKDSGSGLGLAAVSDFVKQSKGHLALKSVEGKGTTVTIHLPVYDEEFVTEAPPLPHASTPRVRRGVRILVVEDNQGVLEAVSLYLRSLGYDILSASDAQQALKIAAYHNDIDLLFSDMVLPGGGTGQDLARSISGSNPNIKVLFTSGYAEDNDQTGYDGEFLLQKPYPLDELRRVIADKLAGD